MNGDTALQSPDHRVRTGRLYGCDLCGASRSRSILIQGLEVGGQLSITTDVENYPGFAEVIQGPWLMEQMAAQASNCGAELVFDSITAIDLSRRPFACTADSGDRYMADALILATGAQARWLGLPSEQKFSGHGVSACATCDGFFFRNKPVAVVGRRQHGRRGSLVPQPDGEPGHLDPPSRSAARREGAAGPPVPQCEGRDRLGQRGRRDTRARAAAP